ncbi:MAG: class I SAM-dependent methyltransferase [Candidatus Omnitrophica bacterium]|nr:class I SAM-dependent methyltransferase [Candidatus Omnitrophota bacterium]
MDRLTTEEYWNAIHEKQLLKWGKPPFLQKVKILVRKILGDKALEYMRSYSDYLLWDVMYEKYLPKVRGLKVLEIGSAPGYRLVKLSQRFDYIPYGIEYSNSGAELNRRIFVLNGIDPQQVVRADFFSDEFQNEYKNFFDIVMSFGFVEHFMDVNSVIGKHLNVLAKGGYLIVVVPNIRGINYILAQFFHKERLLMHNLAIMERETFSKLFNRNLVTVLCDYYGTFDFCLFSSEGKFQKRFILNCCKMLQSMLNVTFRFLFKERRAESKFFSPHLIFIGVRK